MSRHALILGGTGQIGRAVAENLLGHGWAVSIASRGLRPLPDALNRRGAKAVLLDRDTPGELTRALRSGADALIDVTAYGSDHGRQLIAVQDRVGALVVVSSSSVYRDGLGRTLDEAVSNGFPELPEPISEVQATVAPGEATYSTRKVALENLLLDQAQIPLTILRPAAISGPGSLHPREWWFVKRILDRRRVIPLAYDGLSRFHTTSAPNLAELARLVAEHPDTRVLNIADPQALSVAEIGHAIGGAMDYAGAFKPLPDPVFPAKLGRTPWSVPRPFVLDTRAAQALGYKPVTSYAQTVGGICKDLIRRAAREDWRQAFPVLASYAYEHFDYSAEDAAL
ncbi:NAD-dependent epimerase/dehydratase family protein [Caulobacter sp. BK020]|uniref:NAD-dependent epimerase/dehydratase family protein n=1 Tax=Caulobacter sp. BK020 TaxID=2512117 RepID=UPI0010EA8458|nr:NAD-dependent epimerase/dehydratase family protein [Caulobacter sp. BK020]TCS15345.1 nucleoside-diphosphate-sugar epimerase [Caulobacter sp. BK020]